MGVLNACIKERQGIWNQINGLEVNILFFQRMKIH